MGHRQAHPADQRRGPPDHAGSLYPALHRLEQQGWLKAQAGLTETGREAKLYALTPAGRKQLARELESWDRLSTAIGLVVREQE
jgi:DNA-binding PadR family transcriptional regulator